MSWTGEKSQALKRQENFSASLFLQRKCSCGGAAGKAGECSACQGKRRMGSPLQPKLKISEPGDAFEQEADRVAEHIMCMPEPTDQEGMAGNQMAPMVQRTTGRGETGVSAAPPLVHEALSSPGQALDAATKGFFENRLGHDFGKVRIHSDEVAHQSATEVGARAYTVGQDLVFAQGEYRPAHEEGRRLLAHELTHVMQQEQIVGPHMSSYTPQDDVLRRAEGEKAEEKPPDSLDEGVDVDVDVVDPPDVDTYEAVRCPGFEQISSKLSPREEADWRRSLEDLFPNLKGKCYRVLREGGDNCCGFCQGRFAGNGPLEHAANFDIPDTIEDLEKAFPDLEPMEEGSAESSSDAVLAVYGIGTDLKHVACRYYEGEGLWESKLSHALPLIVHGLKDIEGGPSGNILKLYRRKKNQ